MQNFILFVLSLIALISSVFLIEYIGKELTQDLIKLFNRKIIIKTYLLILSVLVVFTVLQLLAIKGGLIPPKPITLTELISCFYSPFFITGCICGITNKPLPNIFGP